MKKSGGGIMHFKMLVFAGQNMVEFGSANFSPFEVRPQAAYTNYISQTVYFTDDPSIVNSFKTKFDDLWVNTSTYSVYANPPAARTRVVSNFSDHPDLNSRPARATRIG